FTTATAITWTGAAGTSDWFNRTNWNPMAVPTAADAVVLNSGIVTVPANASFAVFNLNGGALNGTITLASTMNWLAGNVDAQITIASGGVLNLNGSESKGLAGALVNGGTVIVAAGSYVSVKSPNLGVK